MKGIKMHIKYLLKQMLFFVLSLSMLCSLHAYAQTEQFLTQNWTPEDREYFYFADQGSRLIPYKYFLYLEQADNQQLLRSNANMTRFGLIPTQKSKNNPDALPIGLTRNGDYMGPTCSACHTQQITYLNKVIRIDGGQSFLDLPKFLSAITSSLEATLENKEKFSRFQKNLLGVNPSQRQQDDLKKSLRAELENRKAYSSRNHTDVPYGFTRLDAFGSILNTALAATGEKDNMNSPNAGTSYPYLWDTPQHDYVEWNGSQSNTQVGSLARNIGEVIGVFGEVETTPTQWLGFIDGGYASSIRTRELRKIEHLVSKLHSPLWPSSFPKIDTNLAKHGRLLYQQHCIQCHVDINRTDPKRKIQVRMSTLEEINTDPLMAENVIYFNGKSGILEGKPRYYFAGEKLAKTAPALDIANNLMVGILKNNPLQAYLAGHDAENLGHPDILHSPKYVDGKIIKEGEEVSKKALLAYKARPLNGVWSSAPFLHNGSVPNLYQLLLPAKERVKQFNLGSWEYDPINVGYSGVKTSNSFLFDTTLKGNSNAGHEYGTGYYGLPALTEQERWALVEYLKTL